MIKTAHLNILESSTVTLGAGTEDQDYPLYRLYDRNIGRFFRPTAAETLEVLVDQGGGAGQAVDRLIIPSGHNLEGMALGIRHSDDGVTYTDAVPGWTGTAGLLEKSWTPVSKRYWKFVVTGPSAIPQTPEIFLTSTYQWERDPARPAGPFEDVFSVRNEATSGGQDRFLVHGEPKRQRRYALPRMGEAQKDGLLALNAAWAGSRPFWLHDHEGNWIFVKLAAPLELREIAYQQYSARFEAVEVLP